MTSNNDSKRVSTSVVIPSQPAEGLRVIDDIASLLEAAGFPAAGMLQIRLALEEAIVNAIKHGNQLDPAKSVTICYQVVPGRFDIEITDEGKGFDPADVPDPTALENLERPCGRGLLLMRHYMTEVAYNTVGNAVRMSKVLPGASESSERPQSAAEVP